LSFGCGPELELRLQIRPSDLCAGGRTLSLLCRITLSILLQLHLQERTKVYLRERKYGAKAVGKPESLPYFQSWLPSDTFWIFFRAGESLKQPESDLYGFAMAQRNTTKVI
jgi:hypothetical protein